MIFLPLGNLECGDGLVMYVWLFNYRGHLQLAKPWGFRTLEGAKDQKMGRHLIKEVGVFYTLTSHTLGLSSFASFPR